MPVKRFADNFKRWLSGLLLVASLHSMAQEWGIPEGVECTFVGGLCLHTDSLQASYLMGTYFTFADRVLAGEGSYEASKAFSEHQRQGFWLRADYRLARNFTVGITLPYHTSTIRLSNQPPKKYFLRGISEIRIRLGFDKHWTHISFFAGLSSGLPVQEGRMSFTSPEIPLGNDAYWNIGLEAGGQYLAHSGVGIILNAGLIIRMAQAGYVYWSDTLDPVLGPYYNSIQATIDRRDYFQTTLAIRIPMGRFYGVAGYNLFLEWPDYANNITPLQTPEVLALVQTALGKGTVLHASIAGIFTAWGPFQAGLLAKAYVAGKGGIAENSLSLMIRYQMKM
ncbi:MAG: hypothetical protein ACP5O2_11680 [Bacteroidales bacterium]